MFNQKPTRPDLRKQWLQSVRDRFKVPLNTLRPTHADVDKVIEQLSDSAAGPDGISAALYLKAGTVAKTLVVKVTCALVGGHLEVDESFNHALLRCIPKVADELSAEGIPIFNAGSTRPISVVDASNGPVAAVLKTARERSVSASISPMQRGFIPGRQILINLLDIRTAAQMISLKSKTGCIMLFDFRAAFPSMDHTFIWDVLEQTGIPKEFASDTDPVIRGAQRSA